MKRQIQRVEWTRLVAGPGALQRVRRFEERAIGGTERDEEPRGPRGAVVDHVGAIVGLEAHREDRRERNPADRRQTHAGEERAPARRKPQRRTHLEQLVVLAGL
jgi:hypothetical protein